MENLNQLEALRDKYKSLCALQAKIQKIDKHIQEIVDHTYDELNGQQKAWLDAVANISGDSEEHDDTVVFYCYFDAIDMAELEELIDDEYLQIELRDSLSLFLKFAHKKGEYQEYDGQDIDVLHSTVKFKRAADPKSPFVSLHNYTVDARMAVVYIEEELQEMAEEFVECIVDQYGIEAFDDVQGKCLADVYKYGNDSIDQDFAAWLAFNEYTLNEYTRSELLARVYFYEFDF